MMQFVRQIAEKQMMHFVRQKNWKTNGAVRKTNTWETNDAVRKTNTWETNDAVRKTKSCKPFLRSPAHLPYTKECSNSLRSLHTVLIKGNQQFPHFPHFPHFPCFRIHIFLKFDIVFHEFEKGKSGESEEGRESSITHWIIISIGILGSPSYNAPALYPLFISTPALQIFFLFCTPVLLPNTQKCPRAP